MRKTLAEGHARGMGCDPYYKAVWDARRCLCGRPGIGLDRRGDPVCEVHGWFKVRSFPKAPECPGPHV